MRHTPKAIATAFVATVLAACQSPVPEGAHTAPIVLTQRQFDQITEAEYAEVAAKSRASVALELDFYRRANLLNHAFIHNGKLFVQTEKIPPGARPLRRLAVVQGVYKGGTTYCIQCNRLHPYTRLLLREAAQYDSGKIVGYGGQSIAFANEDFNPDTKLVWIHEFLPDRHIFKKAEPHLVEHVLVDKKTGTYHHDFLPLGIFATEFCHFVPTVTSPEPPGVIVNLK